MGGEGGRGGGGGWKEGGLHEAAGGGLRLAYKLMTTKLYNYAKVLYVLQLSCWTWYSDQVANVKTPEHSMTDALAKT